MEQETLQQLLDRIRSSYGQLSPAQKLVAAYVVENSYQIPFLSITKLANNIGVSDSSVIKFCEQMGYAKFAAFKKKFSGHVRSELVMSNKLSAGNTAAPEDPVAAGMEEDLASIRATLTDPANRQALGKLLPMLKKAKHIYVTGGRASGYMAGLLANALRYLGLKTHAVEFGVGDYWDRLSMATPEDLVIAISMPRYTAQVVEALRLLHQTGVPIALITDTGLSAAHSYADPVFHCSVTSGYYFPGYAGCLSMISAICRAAGANLKEDAAQHISTLETQLLDQGIFL